MVNEEYLGGGQFAINIIKERREKKGKKGTSS